MKKMNVCKLHSYMGKCTKVGLFQNIWSFHEQLKVFHACVKFVNSKYVDITGCQAFGTHSYAPKASYNENSTSASEYNLFLVIIPFHIFQ